MDSITDLAQLVEAARQSKRDSIFRAVLKATSGKAGSSGDVAVSVYLARAREALKHEAPAVAVRELFGSGLSSAQRKERYRKELLSADAASLFAALSTLVMRGSEANIIRRAANDDAVLAEAVRLFVADSPDALAASELLRRARPSQKERNLTSLVSTALPPDAMTAHLVQTARDLCVESDSVFAVGMARGILLAIGRSSKISDDECTRLFAEFVGLSRPATQRVVWDDTRAHG